MQKPFDIPADLHTPVSPYLRLAPLRHGICSRAPRKAIRGDTRSSGSVKPFRSTSNPTVCTPMENSFVRMCSPGLRMALERAPECGPVIKDQTRHASRHILRALTAAADSQTRRVYKKSRMVLATWSYDSIAREDAI